VPSSLRGKKKIQIKLNTYLKIMKVLIVGTGVIGTIYGWPLHEAGIDVTHLVGKGKSQNYSDGVTIDILDERKGYKKYNTTNYWKKITEDLEKRVFFDLIIVPTNWFQTEAALKMVIPYFKDSFFYILTSNWTGTGMYDHILNKN
jgi:ketopantoate reductase